MGTDLIHQWWESDLPVAERVVRAVDLICMERMSRAQAAEVVGIKKDTLSKYLRKWGIDEWVPSGESRKMAHVADKVSCALDLVIGGMSLREALHTADLDRDIFFKHAQHDERFSAVTSAPDYRPPRPQFSWPIEEAKSMLWRGFPEATVADAVGVSVTELQRGIEADAAWCRADGRCRWCEILLDHAEDREGEMCGFCARVLRGQPLFPNNSGLT